jgi:hypothetical protein
MAIEQGSEQKGGSSSSGSIAWIVIGLSLGAVSAIVIGLLVRHNKHNQSESSAEMAFADDLADAGDDDLPSGDDEAKLPDIGSARWLTFDVENSSANPDGE